MMKKNLGPHNAVRPIRVRLADIVKCLRISEVLDCISGRLMTVDFYELDFPVKMGAIPHPFNANIKLTSGRWRLQEGINLDPEVSLHIVVEHWGGDKG